jgi:hypothetical protein
MGMVASACYLPKKTDFEKEKHRNFFIPQGIQEAFLKAYILTSSYLIDTFSRISILFSYKQGHLYSRKII